MTLLTTSAAAVGLLERKPRRLDVVRTAAARRFLFGQGLGQAADAATALVVASALVITDDGTLDAGQLAHTLALATVPYALVGPLAGAVADRWDRRRMLGVVQVARCLCTLLAFVVISGDMHALGATTMTLLLSAARFGYLLRAASLPHVVPGHVLVRADSWSLRISMLSAVAGAGVAGVTGSSSGMLLAAASAHLVAAYGFTSVDRDLGGGGPGGAELSSLHRAAAELVGRPAARFAITATTLHRSLLGACFASFVLANQAAFGSATSSYLIALGVTGAGSFLGTLTAPIVGERLALHQIAAVAHLTPAISLPLAVASGSPTAIALALLIAFLAFQNLRVVTDATVQQMVPDRSLGLAFSIYDAAYNVAYFGGALAAIVFTGGDTGSHVLLVIAALYCITAILGRRSLEVAR